MQIAFPPLHEHRSGDMRMAKALLLVAVAHFATATESACAKLLVQPLQQCSAQIRLSNATMLVRGAWTRVLCPSNALALL